MIPAEFLKQEIRFKLSNYFVSFNGHGAEIYSILRFINEWQTSSALFICNFHYGKWDEATNIEKSQTINSHFYIIVGTCDAAKFYVITDVTVALDYKLTGVFGYTCWARPTCLTTLLNTLQAQNYFFYSTKT